MNRTNRIRTFFCVTAMSCSLAYYLGYEYTTRQEKSSTIGENQSQVADFTTEEDTENDQLVESSSSLPAFEYVIIEEDGYLTVYEQDLKTVFIYTGIPYEELSDELQDEVDVGKLFTSEKELYSFLENYSS